MGGQRLGYVRCAQGVGDGGLGQPGDGDNIARLGAVDRLPFKAAEGEDFRGAPGFQLAAVHAQGLDCHVGGQATGLDPTGENTAEEGVGFQRRRQHAEGLIRAVDLRRWNVIDDQVEQRRHVAAPVVEFLHGPAFLGGGVEHGELKLFFGGVECGEQVEGLVQHPVRAAVGLVDLVDQHDRADAQSQRLGQHELGLRHRAFSGVDQQNHAVDHRQDALDLAAEVGVPGGVDDVDAGVLPLDRGDLGEDGDAALALDVVGVHGAFGHALVFAELAGLLQQAIHQRGLAMVNVRDDRDVAQDLCHQSVP